MNTIVKLPTNGRVDRKRTANNILPSWMDNMLENELGSGFFSNFSNGISAPAINIKENDDAFILEVAAPGLEKNDFDIDVENKILSISCEKSNEETSQNENYTRREFGYSTFKRTFTLPESVDQEKIQASYNNGILNIDLPKREEAKVKPARKIDIA